MVAQLGGMVAQWGGMVAQWGGMVAQLGGMLAQFGWHGGSISNNITRLITQNDIFNNFFDWSWAAALYFNGSILQVVLKIKINLVGLYKEMKMCI
jgi:hypothetical protein